MNGIEITSGALLIVGAGFFFAGTVGVLRFPDVFTRLHALTKADNLGLGFVTVGLVLDADDLFEVVELGMVWVLVVTASSVSCQLVARVASRRGTEPWRRS